MNRNQHIDRLRGVSIISVYLLHYVMFLPRTFWPLNCEFVGNGNYGVMIFFVVSGFLITNAILRRWDDQISLHAFYQMRFARIGPGLVMLLILLWLLPITGLPTFTPPADHSLTEATWYAVTFRYHWLLNQNNIDGMKAWSPLWSLSVEEMFYIFYPLLLITLQRRVAIILLLVIIVCGPQSRLSFSPYGFMGALDCLALGCLVAFAKPHFSPFIARLVRWVAAAAIAATYLLSYFTTDAAFAISIIAIGSAIYIAGSANQLSETPQWNLVDRFTQYLGRLSYEIYLLHLPIILLFSNWPHHNPQSTFIEVSSIVILAAWISSRFVTEPLNHLIRRSNFLLPFAQRITMVQDRQ